VIRLAQAKDADSLRSLISQCIPSSIPHTRGATLESVQSYCAQTYSQLEQMMQQPNLVILVEQEKGTRDITGYLILDFASVEPSTGEKQCFIIDLGVDPGRRGRFTTHRLLAKAAKMASARGLGYLVGVVSSSNPRTLQLALKGLDFEVERVQIVRRCIGS
jgi:ribosomal protein S18 acetylase RimI-like enzyme